MLLDNICEYRDHHVVIIISCSCNLLKHVVQCKVQILPPELHEMGVYTVIMR